MLLFSAGLCGLAIFRFYPDMKHRIQCQLKKSSQSSQQWSPGWMGARPAAREYYHSAPCRQQARSPSSVHRSFRRRCFPAGNPTDKRRRRTRSPSGRSCRGRLGLLEHFRFFCVKRVPRRLAQIVLLYYAIMGSSGTLGTRGTSREFVNVELGTFPMLWWSLNDVLLVYFCLSSIGVMIFLHFPSSAL